MNIINLKDLSHKDLISSKTGEMYSKSSVLTEQFGFQDIFVHHEILPQGTRSSSPHYHTFREEMIFVLYASPTCHLGHQVYQMKSGDCVGFTPGKSEPHYIENVTNELVKLLVICSNPKDDDTVYD